MRSDSPARTVPTSRFASRHSAEKYVTAAYLVFLAALLLGIGFDDLLSALRSPSGRCLFGFGESDSDNRAHDALTQAQMDMTLDVMAHSLVYWAQDLWRGGFLGEGSKLYAMTSEGSTRVVESYGAVSAAKARVQVRASFMVVSTS